MVLKLWHLGLMLSLIVAISAVVSCQSSQASESTRSSLEAGMEEGFWYSLDQIPFVPAETIRVIAEDGLPKSWYDPVWDDMQWAWLEDGAEGVADGVGAGAIGRVYDGLSEVNDWVSIANNYVKEFGT